MWTDDGPDQPDEPYGGCSGRAAGSSYLKVSDRPSSEPAFGAPKASAAGVYDALLGGKDNFAADRQVAAELAAKAPEVYAAARANRAFLVRVVRFLAELGIGQFIDLGSGFPTSPNVHEVARAVRRDARVIYVDDDPVVAAHGRALNKADMTAVVQADLREPGEILDAAAVRELIDFSEPVAVLAIAVLHFLSDQDSVAAIFRLREAMAPGSYLAVSHASPGTRTDVDEAAEVYAKTTAPIWVRTPEQVRCYFTGCELVEPGLVPVQHWRRDLALPRDAQIGGQPDEDPASPRAVFIAGVARITESGDG